MENSFKNKKQPKPFLSFFFIGMGPAVQCSYSSGPLSLVQISTGPSGPLSTGWTRPTFFCVGKSHSLGSLYSLRPTSSLQAPPRAGAPAHERTRGCRGARAAMAAGGGGVADSLSSAGVPCAFSPQSQAYFALASADGHLRVWETASNRLHQEYVPSAHLSGTCTCLAWAPARLQAKVKRAGRRGLGARPGSASASPGPTARDRASRVALGGPGRGGTECGGGGGGAEWAHVASLVRGLSGGQRLSARPDPTGSGPEPYQRAPCGLRSPPCCRPGRHARRGSGPPGLSGLA